MCFADMPLHKCEVYISFVATFPHQRQRNGRVYKECPPNSYFICPLTIDIILQFRHYEGFCKRMHVNDCNSNENSAEKSRLVPNLLCFLTLMPKRLFLIEPLKEAKPLLKEYTVQ